MYSRTLALVAAFFLLFAGVSHAQQSNLTIVAGPYNAASAPGVTFKAQVNGAETGSCSMPRIGQYDCPRCDLGSYQFPLGTSQVTMTANLGTQSAASTVLSVQVNRTCMTPNSAGAMRCNLDIIPTPSPSANPCVTAPVLTWKTPATGTFRMYSVVNGALGSAITKKATAKADCNCPANPIKSGTSTYCPLAGGPSNEVTLCVRS